MRRTLVASLVAALALVAPATAGLSAAGILDPGRSLGGVRIGESAKAVRAALGSFYGVCTDCARPTWYFTYKKFDAHGLAVELTGGRVSGLYTLWQPAGWRTSTGLLLGASPLTTHRKVGFLRTIACQGYDALVADTGRVRTAYYLFNGRLWALGLFERGADPCR